MDKTRTMEYLFSMESYVVGLFCFEWADEKNESNRRKHGIDFETTATLWERPETTLELRDERHEEETRWVTFGQLPRGEKVAVVVSCERGEKIRLISARFADKDETDLFFEKMALLGAVQREE